MGPSEYKKEFGILGEKPLDKYVDKNFPQKVRELPLKMGTTQATSHIPNYTGFIPCAKTVGDALV